MGYPDRCPLGWDKNRLLSGDRVGVGYRDGHYGDVAGVSSHCGLCWIRWEYPFKGPPQAGGELEVVEGGEQLG